MTKVMLCSDERTANVRLVTGLGANLAVGFMPVFWQEVSLPVPRFRHGDERGRGTAEAIAARLVASMKSFMMSRLLWGDRIVANA